MAKTVGNIADVMTEGTNQWRTVQDMLHDLMKAKEIKDRGYRGKLKPVVMMI